MPQSITKIEEGGKFYIGDVVRLDTTPGHFDEGTIIRKHREYNQPEVYLVDCSSGRRAYRYAIDLRLITPWFANKSYTQ